MKKEKFSPELYSDTEIDAIEKHISRYFGECDNVFHELLSPDIHVDIYIIKPTKERPWITLITVGMGAHKMNVPAELAGNKLERAELVITLPSDWDINGRDEKDYWPIRLLKGLARLPINCDTWLGYGHTIDNGEPFADNTDMNSSLLLLPVAYEDESWTCAFSDDDEVNFYQVLPLYTSEVDFKHEHGLDALLDKFSGVVSPIVDPERIPVSSNMCDVIDWKGWHCATVAKKNLPLDEITGYNHMAIFVRWCIENDLMSDIFREYFGDVIMMVKEDPSSFDLRELLRDEFGGALDLSLFNDKGTAFAKHYYNHYSEEGEPCYPADVDDHALEFFGSERYNSDEFKDEAYLFVPYDEKYYSDMKKIIDEEYRTFLAQRD